jgi:hypothetical protein
MTSSDDRPLQKIKGSCLCGAVSFEVVNTFEKLFLCSCDQCRQITGSAFSSNLFVRKEGFGWLEGAGGIVSYKVPGRDISKAFCQICGSGVPWENGDGTKMIVPAGSMSEPVNVAERFRIFTSERPAWVTDLEQIPAHAEFPEPLGSELMGPKSLPTDKSTIIGSEKT